MGFFNRLKEGLTKTRDTFVRRVEEIVTGRKAIDEEMYEELEEALIQGDVGATTAFELVETLRKRVKAEKVSEPAKVETLLHEEIAKILGQDQIPLNIEGAKPAVVLVVGVNGVGKTTTIGKLAYRLREEGKKVLLAAGDTFRAGAIEQLEVWGQRTGCDVIKHQEGSDPAAVAFDAVQAAKSRKVDVLLLDTAGRLHNKVNLMEELKKIRRVVEREMPGAPQEVLLVLDATTGQNAVSQAKLFGEIAGVTGIALTKLDGTAKGGVIIAVKAELNVPVKYIGIGEKMDDLRDFDATDFARALFGGFSEEENEEE